MEALGILIGAGLAALSPIIPGLRSVTKAVIKSGMALTDAATGVAAAAAAGWSGLASEVSAEQSSSEYAIEESAAADDATAVSAAVEASPAVAAGVPTAAAAAMVAAETSRKAAAEAEDGSTADEMGSRQGSVAAGDDLTQINGIGPKVAALLHDADITSFAQLEETDVEQLRAILANAGSRYKVVNPESWPEQAKLLGQQVG